MPITENQLAKRSGYIGSSDVAALFGVSPYKSTYDLWLEKTGQLEPEPQGENTAMRLGNLFEGGVLDFAESELGPLTRNQFRVDREGATHLGCNIDALVRSDGSPVEAKTAGLVGPLRGVWGEPGTAEIPDLYILQCTAHLIVTGRDVCHVPAVIGGRGPVMYRVPADEELMDAVRVKCREFWALVESRTPPTLDAGVPSLDIMARVRRVPSKIIALPERSLVDAWQAAKDAAAAAAKQADEAKALMLAALGDAEAATLPEGDAITYYEYERAGLDAKALKAAHPELVAQFERVSKYRTVYYKKKGI